MPSINQIYCLIKRARDTILKSLQDLKMVKDFGPSGVTVMTGCDEELEDMWRWQIVCLCQIWPMRLDIVMTNLKHYLMCRQ